eukprot:GFUD01037265.1.p2 GENE.GFUD01037265.1~~GFUD01037265.1.p2  ORF type:complete len:230 (+),score=65.68 GFUD01037265.1:838-1527(+)
MTDYCKHLPENILSVGGPGPHSSDQSDLKLFLETKLPPSDRREISGEFKKTLVLAAQKSKQKKNKPARKSRQYLTAKERRALGLYRLPKKGLKYSSFLPLHTLWTGYMEELLDLASLEKGGWSPNLNEETRQLQLQMRICRADLHGASVKVVGANCSTHMGVEGIVAMETKNTIQIISKDNTLRILPKLGSSFSFRVGEFLLTIPGACIDSKPGERATKKLKNKFPCEF